MKKILKIIACPFIVIGGVTLLISIFYGLGSLVGWVRGIECGYPEVLGIGFSAFVGLVLITFFSFVVYREFFDDNAC